MGNAESTRWRGYTKKQTVEECRRINAREARHVGIELVSTPVAGGTARRFWCICPACGARVGYLYQLPNSVAWKCRKCHGLVYKSAQQRGTYAAFYEWLEEDNRKQWGKYASRHPSREWLHESTLALWIEKCAPFDLRSMSDERRLELLLELGSIKAIQQRFEKERADWSKVAYESEQRAAAWTMADLKAEWKARHRSKSKAKN